MDEDEEEVATGEEMNSAIGKASVEVMDIMDDDLAMMVATFYAQSTLLVREFCERGIDGISAIQLVVSHCAGAAAEAAHA